MVTPRRQRRNDASVENPEIKIARELREQRMLELKRLLEEDQQVYRYFIILPRFCSGSGMFDLPLRVYI